MDKPKTEKQSEAGGGLGLRYGISSMQGWRIEMEDAHCAKIGLPYGLDEWSFFAVFDGHAGPKVSAHSADNLLDTILQGIQQQFQPTNNTQQQPNIPKTAPSWGYESGLSPEEEQIVAIVDLVMGRTAEITTTTTNTTTTNTTATDPFQNSGKGETSPSSVTDATTTDIETTATTTPETTTTKDSIIDTTIETPATSDNNNQTTTDNSTTTTSSATQQQESLNTNHHKSETSGIETPTIQFSKPIANSELTKVTKAIHDGFLQLDAKMRALPGEDRSGSTAVCAMISPDHFFFANCGDSRAVLSRNGEAYFSTEDHKPINPGERERIQNAGGSVMIQRVNGSLAVSRALGDFEYKQVEGKGPCEQLVSPEPEVTIETRQLQYDEFLVLACDGIFDVMSNEELCDFIRYQLRIHKDLEYICSSVIDTCLHKGSRDNMSIVLVVLPGAPTVTKEAIEQDEQLNRQIREEVEEIMKEEPAVSLTGVLNQLLYSELKNLPPGGGIDSKRKVIEEVINRIRPESK